MKYEIIINATKKIFFHKIKNINIHTQSHALAVVDFVGEGEK